MFYDVECILYCTYNISGYQERFQPGGDMVCLPVYQSYLSYIAFDLICDTYDGMSESCFTISYTHNSTPSMVLKDWNHLI